MTVDEASAVVRGRFPVTEDDKRRTYEIAARTLANACDSRLREIEELRAALQAVREAYDGAVSQCLGAEDCRDTLLSVIEMHVLPLTEGSHDR